MVKIEDEKVVIQTVNIPGHTSKVNAEKYNAMKTALMEVLPSTEPGVSQKEKKNKSLLPGKAKSS